MILKIIRNNKFLFVLLIYIFLESSNFISYCIRYKYFSELRYNIKDYNNVNNFKKYIINFIINNKSWYDYAKTFYNNFGINLKNEKDKTLLLKILTDNEYKIKNNSIIGSQGNTDLVFSYKPFLVKSLLYLVKYIGEIRLYYLGFTKNIHHNNDGIYCVWSRKCKLNINKKPIIFFPGYGLGSVLYLNIYNKFDREIHIIEVPNISSFTKSNSHCTSKNLNKIIKIYDKNADFIAHSLGTLHCSMYINFKNNYKLKKKIVLCDPFCLPINFIDTLSAPLINYDNYKTIKRIRNNQYISQIQWFFIVWFIYHDIEFQSWTKRFARLNEILLWKQYKNIKFKYIFGEKDIMISSHLLKNVIDYNNILILPKGKHGSCFFGKRSDHVINYINFFINN